MSSSQKKCVICKGFPLATRNIFRQEGSFKYVTVSGILYCRLSSHCMIYSLCMSLKLAHYFVLALRRASCSTRVSGRLPGIIVGGGTGGVL